MDLTKTNYHNRQYIAEAYTDTAKYCSFEYHSSRVSMSLIFTCPQ
jgi:hypothetical protein